MTPSQWGNPIVTSIVPMGEEIYCSGTFEVAGGKPSSFIAKWRRWPVGAEESQGPGKSMLNLKNQPNPFSQSTIISWRSAVGSRQSAVNSQVVIKIFDSMGKLIKTLVDEDRSPGEHQVTFDAADLPAGVYFYQIQVNGMYETKRMVIIK